MENKSPLRRQTAFGKSRGSRREHDRKRIVFAHVDVGLLGALAGEKPAIASVGRQRQWFEKTQILEFFGLGEFAGTVFLKNDESRLERRNHRRELERFPFDVEWDRQRADLRSRENNLQMLDPIAHRQRHAVALAHAERKQPMRQLIHARVELAVSNLPRPIFSRDLEWKFPSVAAQAVAHEHLRIHFGF